MITFMVSNVRVWCDVHTVIAHLNSHDKLATSYLGESIWILPVCAIDVMTCIHHIAVIYGLVCWNGFIALRLFWISNKRLLSPSIV